MIGWMTNTVATDVIYEIFGPVIELVIVIAIAMIVTIICLILKFLYNFFLRENVVKLKHKELDIGTLSNVGIPNLELTKKIFENQFLVFIKNIYSGNRDKLQNIVYCCLIESYENKLERLNDYRCNHVFEDTKIIYSSIYDCKSVGDVAFAKILLIVKSKEYITGARGQVVKGSKIFKRKSYYYLTYRKEIKYDTKYTCPSCGILIKSSNISFCSNCGTKIDDNIDGWKLIDVDCENGLSYYS